MNIKGYQFEGPYAHNTTNFNSVGAVYVISDPQNNPIDVGQTNDLKERMGNHERYECWQRNAKGQIYVYALVNASEATRVVVEKTVRGGHSFTCGIF